MSISLQGTAPSRPGPHFRTVLLIDDDEIDNEQHRRVLAASGLAGRVVTFNYAESALQALQRDELDDVDLILLDINMPRMNGFEFLEAYARIDRPEGRCIVVMVTTSRDDRDRLRAGRFESVLGYVTKPLTRESLDELFGPSSTGASGELP